MSNFEHNTEWRLLLKQYNKSLCFLLERDICTYISKLCLYECMDIANLYLSALEVYLELESLSLQTILLAYTKT